MTPLLCFETGDVSCVVLQRRPELGRGSQDILERAWHHADDSIEVVVERNLATQDRAVAAEATPPQCITEDHYVGAAELIVGWLEVFTQRRRNAQRAEIAGAHTLAIQTFRLGRAGHGWLPWLHDGDRIEGMAPFRHFAIRVERYVATRATENIP